MTFHTNDYNLIMINMRTPHALCHYQYEKKHNWKLFIIECQGNFHKYMCLLILIDLCFFSGKYPSWNWWIITNEVLSSGQVVMYLYVYCQNAVKRIFTCLSLMRYCDFLECGAEPELSLIFSLLKFAYMRDSCVKNISREGHRTAMFSL